MMETQGESHYQFKLRCQDCRLHFIVLSWDKDWPARHVPYCPECGRNQLVVFAGQYVSLPICKVVPGGQKPVGLWET